MSEQPLNLKRSLQILRRHRIAFGLTVMLGLFAGAAYTMLNPPMYTATALVALPSSTQNATTQAVIANSNAVLARAARSIDPAMSLLSRRVQVTTPFSDVLSVSAQGESAAQAVDTANAVANSYVAYASATNTAEVLQPAASASKTPLLVPLLVTAGIGALAGAAVGTVAVLAAKRDDRRLRLRDEIADAISVPVLASVPVRHATKAHQLASLLDEYEPDAADAQRLRNALDYLGLADVSSGGSSLTVLSLSSDRRALALGPQLAVFAASRGIHTALVIDGRLDVSTAELRAACAITPSSRRSSQLQVAVAEDDSTDWPDAALAVVVTAMDGRVGRIADTIRTRALVLGVSAGAVTAEQLARVAASAADDGRYVAGILVGDPDPADLTTGRLPQLGRRTQMPTRTTGMALVTRR
jgi:capsular polysaccharide biosynthesis protein